MKKSGEVCRFRSGMSSGAAVEGPATEERRDFSLRLLDYLENNDMSATVQNKQAGKAISCH